MVIEVQLDHATEEELQLQCALRWIHNQPHSLEAAAACKVIIDKLRELEQQVSTMRVGYCRMAYAEGYSFDELGAVLGVSRQRAAQIVRK